MKGEGRRGVAGDIHIYMLSTTSVICLLVIGHAFIACSSTLLGHALQRLHRNHAVPSHHDHPQLCVRLLVHRSVQHDVGKRIVCSTAFRRREASEIQVSRVESSRGSTSALFRSFALSLSLSSTPTHEYSHEYNNDVQPRRTPLTFRPAFILTDSRLSISPLSSGGRTFTMVCMYVVRRLYAVRTIGVNTRKSKREEKRARCT